MDNYLPLAELIGFKGINADFIPELLPNADSPVYITDGDNVLIRNGRIEKLRGIGFLNDITSQRGVGSARRILSLPVYETYDQDKFLLAFTPEQVEYLTEDPITHAQGWTDIGGLAGTDDSIVSCVNIDNKIVWTLHDDPTIRYWNLIGNHQHLVDDDAIRARFLMKHKTWLFLVRPLQFIADEWVERHQEIWPSYPGVPADFDNEDRLMIDADGAINGCRELEDAPIIYFPKSIHRVYLISDEAGFGSQPITDTEGLMCPKTLTGGRGIHFFMTKKGMSSMRLGASPVPLSWSKFNRLIIDGIDPLYYKRAIARYFDDSNLLYVAFPPAGQADNGKLLIYDTMENELVGQKALTAINYSSFGVFEKDLSLLTSDERRSYGVGGIPLVGTSDGLVLEEKYTVYQQLNDVYESRVEIPPMFFGDRHKNKRLMQADLIVEKLTDEAITFNIEISNEANVTTVTPYVVAGTGNQGIRRYEVMIDVFGKEFRTVIKDSGNPYGFKLHGIIFRGYFSTLK
jgi:hypothetical protein